MRYNEIMSFARGVVIAKHMQNQFDNLEEILEKVEDYYDLWEFEFRFHFGFDFDQLVLNYLTKEFQVTVSVEEIINSSEKLRGALYKWNRWGEILIKDNERNTITCLDVEHLDKNFVKRVDTKV